MRINGSFLPASDWNKRGTREKCKTARTLMLNTD